MFWKYKYSCLVIAAIWVACLTPHVELTIHVPTNSDKAVHAMMYLVLCSVLWTEYRRAHRGERLPVWRSSLFMLFLPAAMGGAIELLQPYVNRSCDFQDFLFNCVGCVIAFAVFFRPSHA